MAGSDHRARARRDDRSGVWHVTCPACALDRRFRDEEQARRLAWAHRNSAGQVR